MHIGRACKAEIEENKISVIKTSFLSRSFYILPIPPGKWEKGENMAEFTVINTQEEFDERIKERLERERRTVAEQFKDYEEIKGKAREHESTIDKLNASLSEANGKLKENEATIADLNGKVKKYESNSVKMRIAQETGIPIELASKLSGDSEEAIRKDAESLAKFVSKKRGAPLSDPDPEHIDAKKMAMKNMLSSLKGE